MANGSEYNFVFLKPQSHISKGEHRSPGNCRIPPDQDLGWFMFCCFVSANGRPKTITPVPGWQLHGRMRTNTDTHGSNTQSTRRLHGQSWHSDGLTRTKKAETMTDPDKHRVYMDLHDSYTDQHGRYMDHHVCSHLPGLPWQFWTS